MSNEIPRIEENERATRLAKQLKESQHSISSNGVVKQIILTNIGENEIDINVTGMTDKESIFVLAMALIRCSKKLGLTEATLNKSMSCLWKDTD
ncbi:hypothetical protein [Enterococcus sp. DIV1375a]|uniref:hypothetical protein n=1 Tax=Enterococcus sp. DIV1375a TaxID=2774755 RepID=UPI003F688402